MRAKHKAVNKAKHAVMQSEEGKISAFALQKIILTTQNTIYRAIIASGAKVEIGEYRGKPVFYLNWNECEKVINYIYRRGA